MNVATQPYSPSHSPYAAAREPAPQPARPRPVPGDIMYTIYQIEENERRAAEQQARFDRTGRQPVARLLGAVAGAAYLTLPCAAICLPQSTQWWAWTATGAAAVVGAAAGASLIRGGHCTAYGRFMLIVCGYVVGVGAAVGAAVAYGTAEQARHANAQLADLGAATSSSFSLNTGAMAGIILATGIGLGLAEHAIIRLTRCI